VAEALRRNEIVFDEKGEVTAYFERDPKRDWRLSSGVGNPWAVELNKVGLTEEARAASDYWQTLSFEEKSVLYIEYFQHEARQSKLHTGTPLGARDQGIELPFFNSTSKENIMNEFFKIINKSLEIAIDNTSGNSIEQVQKDKRILTEFRNTMQEVYSKNG
ncbi:hypothetical protein CCZ01_08320, partial [Helicobacter monodelphidis]|uniref:hypothetical protein n=1 Tax=Helicobacter sp. 15-1451 TaxID=2004995 RepID=UPI000DCC3B19